MLVYLWTALCRNLPHRVTEADRRQICTWWVSGQQRSGHQRPSNHWWAERQQTPVLPKPVTLHDTSSTIFHLPTSTLSLHHHCTSFFFFHSCSFALFYSLPSIVFYIELLNSLVLFSFAMKENFKKPSLVTLSISWSDFFFLFFFMESMWSKAVAAVVMKPVKLFELKHLSCTGGCEVHWNGYH